MDRILDLASDCESDIRELSRAIESDPAITSKVLRLSNSAYFGVAGGVGTVDRAILVVGYKNVLSLATCAALAPIFSSAGSSLDRGTLWLHSCATAEAARLLAEATGFDSSLAYVAGLLHDLGVVVLAEVFEKEYEEVLAECRRSGDRLARSEARLLGVDHAWAAGVLFERWTLPERLCTATALHHDPSQDATGFAALVAIANHLVSAAGLFGPEEWMPCEPPSTRWLEATGLSSEQLTGVVEDFETRRAAIELGAGVLDT